MPAVSQDQAHAIGAKYARGEVSRDTLEDFNKGVRVSSLPKHSKKSSRKRKRGATKHGRRGR